MKVKLAFVAILLCLLMPCLAACGDDVDVFDKYAERGYTCRVTYDFGAGIASGKNSLLYLVQTDSLIPQIGVTQTRPSTDAPVLAGHHLAGYYYKDADGSEHDWDFETDRVTTDITLYARWNRDYAVEVRYGDELEFSYSISVETLGASFDNLRTAKWDQHTFYGFYADPEFTTPLSFPYVPAVSDDDPTVTVYARYLGGNYTIIRKPTDFGKQLRAGTNYYLDADIDLTGLSLTLPDTYTGHFNGNGHTISGLQVTREQGRTSNSYGLFGTIGSTAIFENITFTDLSVTVNLDNKMNRISPQHIGILAGTVNSGAVFTNVTVSGSLTYCCYGRDLTDDLIVDNVFGYLPDDIDASSVSATVTVTEVPAPTSAE